jgi:hypothetical protein
MLPYWVSPPWLGNETGNSIDVDHPTRTHARRDHGAIAVTTVAARLLRPDFNFAVGQVRQGRCHVVAGQVVGHPIHRVLPHDGPGGIEPGAAGL